MTKSEEIKMRYDDIHKKLEQLKSEYKKNKAHLKADLERLQNECPHKNKVANPDFLITLYDCPDCGKRLF